MINEGKLPLEDEERYDIRRFLDRSQIDESRYQQLRDDGISHHQAMKVIHQEMGTEGIDLPPKPVPLVMLVRRLVSALLSPVLAAGIRDNKW